MNRTAIVSALALALVASTITAVGDTTPAAAPVDGHLLDERVVTLDPAAILAAIEAGEAFDLPTIDGEAVIAAGPRVQDLISYTDEGPDGEQITYERPPNVWHVNALGDSARGAALSFGHTFRAWLGGENGTTLVEPLAEGPGVPLPITEYRVYHVPGPIVGPRDPGESGDDSSIGILSHIQVFLKVYAYVDTQYRDEYGSCCWADQIDWILTLLNPYFDDIELEYTYHGGQVDSGFNSNSLSDAWNRLVGLSYNGAHVKSHWSFKDFDGCEVGTASLPGSIFVIQHKSDACHLGLLPGNDAERAYLTAHELGKNNNANPAYHWSDVTLTGHEHRSIMDDSLWGHYHGCWSETNMDRMSSYRGTSSVGTPC